MEGVDARTIKGLCRIVYCLNKCQGSGFSQKREVSMAKTNRTPRPPTTTPPTKKPRGVTSI